MSEQVNEKKQAAVRLFGALSGVDEKYLAACEQDEGAVKPTGIVAFVRKAGKPLAAVLCLALLGAGYLSVQRTVGTDGTASVEKNQSLLADEACGTQAASEFKEAMQEAACEEAEVREDPENGALSGAVGADGMQKDSLDAAAKEEVAVVEEVTIEEATMVAVVGDYVPMDWPDGGTIQTVKVSETPGAELVEVSYVYDDGAVILVKVMNLGTELPLWVEDKIEQEEIYVKDTFCKENLREKIAVSADGNEGVKGYCEQFGILYQESAEYVLVSVAGQGTEEVIWKLLK